MFAVGETTALRKSPRSCRCHGGPAVYVGAPDVDPTAAAAPAVRWDVHVGLTLTPNGGGGVTDITDMTRELQQDLIFP